MIFIIPINDTGASSLPYVFTYSLAVPYIAIGLVLLLVGIVGIRTKNPVRTILTGIVSSSLLYLVIGSSWLVLSAGAFLGLLFLALLMQYFRKDKGGKGIDFSEFIPKASEIRNTARVASNIG